MSDTLSYCKPSSVQDAALSFERTDEARYLSGGMTLLPTMRMRLVAPDQLIDLSDCGLSDIVVGEGEMTIGAMATHHKVATSSVVQDLLPALSDLAGGIGDRQVRARGTIGGSVANNDPAACYPAAVLALNATIITNQRRILAEDYFVDLFETALSDSEIITGISFPIASKAGYVKAPNPASRYALVGVFVAQTNAGIRVAVTGAGEAGVFSWQEAQTALETNFSSSAVAGIKADTDGLMADIHASADFRAHMMTTMLQKAVTKANAPHIKEA
ncbi:MAG: FAD binding domain-containing protein [Candidatus Puniceispirillaceae bacterium]